MIICSSSPRRISSIAYLFGKVTMLPSLVPTIRSLIRCYSHLIVFSPPLLVWYMLTSRLVEKTLSLKKQFP